MNMHSVRESIRNVSAEETAYHHHTWFRNSTKVCRCCLANVDPREVYEEIDAEALKSLLNLCLPEDQRLPKLMCPECASYLKGVKKFRETVTAAHTKLMQEISRRLSVDDESQNVCQSIVEANARGSIKHDIVVKREFENEGNSRNECLDPLANLETLLGDSTSKSDVKIEKEIGIERQYLQDPPSPPSPDHMNESSMDHIDDIKNEDSVALDYCNEHTDTETKRSTKKLMKWKKNLQEKRVKKAKTSKMSKLKSTNNDNKPLQYLINQRAKRRQARDRRKSMQSSDCADFSDEEDEKKTKKRSVRWSFYRKFDCTSDAETALESEDTWSLHYYHSTSNGKKCYYRCNKLKRRGPQCSAKIYLLFVKSSNTVFMYRTKAEHDHDQKTEHSSRRSRTIDDVTLQDEKLPQYKVIKTKKPLKERAKRKTKEEKERMRPKLKSVKEEKVRKKRVKILKEEGDKVGRKREVVPWSLSGKFDNAVDAENAVKSEETWSFHYLHDTDDGRKYYYRCNKLKRRGPQCSAKLYLLFDKSSEAVYLYRSDSLHDHDQKMDVATAQRLTTKVKAEINRLHALNMKPKAIILSLMKMQGVEIPKITQLRNYLMYRKRRLSGLAAVPSTSESYDLSIAHRPY